MDRKREQIIIGECKFKNEEVDKTDFETMLSRKSIFPHATRIFFYAFSKSGFTKWVQENADANNVKLVTISDMFLV